MYLKNDDAILNNYIHVNVTAQLAMHIFPSIVK